LEEAPDHRTVFQLTSKRWTICPGDPWGAETPRSRLVVADLLIAHVPRSQPVAAAVPALLALDSLLALRSVPDATFAGGSTSG
jgi:hypothetical protein